MSDLTSRIQSDMVSAMKNHEATALSVLRMLKSALQLAQADKGKDADLSDEEVFTVIRRLVKQRHEAAELYKEGGACDRAESELAEAKVLEAYLPAQLSDEELAAIVAEIGAKVGASSMKDMGKMMGQTVAAAKGRADGNRIKGQVQKYLASLA